MSKIIGKSHLKENVFFTSDLHFGHLKMAQFRKFSSVEKMNEKLIENWNSKIKKGDLIYCLGDFSFLDGEKTSKIIDKLNGSIQYMKGNHEKNLKDFQQKFISVNDMKEIIVSYDGEGSYDGKISITLCHYAMKRWNKSHYGSLNFHGHGHTNKIDTWRSLDVGVDVWNLFPITFYEAMERLNSLPQTEKEY